MYVCMYVYVIICHQLIVFDKPKLTYASIECVGRFICLLQYFDVQVYVCLKGNPGRKGKRGPQGPPGLPVRKISLILFVVYKQYKIWLKFSLCKLFVMLSICYLLSLVNFSYFLLGLKEPSLALWSRQVISQKYPLIVGNSSFPVFVITVDIATCHH